MPSNPRSGRPRSRESNAANEMAKEALLAEVASRYYIDRLTQEEIARQIDRSVATVSRLLAKAEAAAIVEVRVRYPVPIVPALQAALVKRFGLRIARVARISSDDSRSLVTQISDLAARYISTLLIDGTVIAVAWGSTVHGVVYAITPGQQRNMHVVQGVGSLGSRLPTVDNPLLIQVLAERIDATPHYLPAPMIVESVATRDALSRDPHFRATLELGGQADIALVGIGQADPDDSGLVRAGYLERSAMEEIRAIGAVGDMMVEFYDINGRFLDTNIRPRVMGMREAELRKARSVIAVAGGSAKVAAILGALRAGVVHTLVTDNVTALRVLELDDAQPIERRPPAVCSGPVERPTSTAISERPSGHSEARARETVSPEEAPGVSVFPNMQRELEAILEAFIWDKQRGEGQMRLALSTLVEGQLTLGSGRLQRDLISVWRKPVLDAIKRGRERGELATDLNPGIVAEMVLGALWYRLWSDAESVDEVFLRELVATVTARPSRADRDA